MYIINMTSRYGLQMQINAYTCTVMEFAICIAEWYQLVLPKNKIVFSMCVFVYLTNAHVIVSQLCMIERH